MDFVDIAIFAMFRACELGGAAIFAMRLGATLPGILGVVGFAVLFLVSIAQRFVFGEIDVSQEVLGVSIIASVVAFGLVLCALWLVPSHAVKRS